MTGITLRCNYCGRPIIGAVVNGGQAEPYHPECARGPFGDDRIREIVREELSRAGYAKITDRGKAPLILED